jgi:hypothetical protein
MAIDSGKSSPPPFYTPVADLAKVVIILLIVEAAIALVAVYFALVSALSSLVAIASSILFLLWFYRVYRNLPALGASELRFTPGWAVVWWFIPILNLWKPYQVTIEIMKGSDPIVGKTDAEIRKGMRRSMLILIWWVFSYITLAVAIAAGISNGIAGIQESNNSSQTYPDSFSLTLGIMTAVDIWLSILVIKEISKRQGQKIEIIRSGGYSSG